MPVELWILLPFFFAGAILYTSVGHGGATIYLAILTLAGYAVDVLATTVLVLNIVAAGLSFWFFQHAGHLRARLLWPFLVTSVPAAYLGGILDFTSTTQEIVLGTALALAAARFIFFPTPTKRAELPQARTFWILAPLIGAILGFLAGAIGIGGGIFLSPVLVFLGWATVREAGTVAAAFIVINSVAGLAARLPRTPLDVGFLVPLAVVVAIGALLGGFLGARKLPQRGLQIALGIVLVVAAVKAFL